MKQTSIIIFLSFYLILATSLTVSADPGFRLGFGYENLNNELTLTTPDVQLEVNSPCPMLFIEAGYDFENSFAIDAKYGRCIEDQTLFAVESSILAAEIATDSDTDLFSVEASYTKQLGLVTLKGIVGYLESDYLRELSGRLFDLSGDFVLERGVSGVYLGAEANYAITDQFQLGAAYRWLIDPDLDLQVADYSPDVSDPSSSQLEIYAQTGLAENLSLKASYSVSWVEYDLSDLDVENKTDGLSLKLQYQF